MPPYRVLVVDDQYIARGFFEMHVRAAEHYELAGSLPEAEMALPFCEKEQVDLILMDVMMRHGIDGITTAAQIKSRFPQIRIILTTSAAEANWEDRARAVGVDSFWYKEYSEEPLLTIMDKTMAGQSVYPSDPPEVDFGRVTRADLTERQLDVLRELTAGSTNEEIAEKLCISVFTVKRHIQDLLEKTGYESRLALAVHARSLGLVVSEKDRLDP